MAISHVPWGVAARAGATVAEEKGSHAIYVSQPKAVAELIERAGEESVNEIGTARYELKLAQ
jgi:hypothetical protein